MITFINHSDVRGGASVVSLRLLLAMRRRGIDARMLVVHKGTDHQCVEQAGHLWQRKWNFLRECVDIYVHNGFSRSRLFQASTGECGLPLARHPWVTGARAVLLNWVNQGMLSLSEIGRISAPVIWTMHDMWCLTGVCHHAGACQRYAAQCGQCPVLDSHTNGDLSHRVWTDKRNLYADKPIAFVAVSSWLASKCRQSSLLGNQRVQVIPNAFPIDEFTLQARRPRQAYGLPDDLPLVVMGAARLDDPVKRLDLAIDAINQAGKVGAVFFGDLRNPELLQRLRVPYRHLGPVSDFAVINDLYAHSAVVLSSSSYETLPGTLIEGMAAGCVPVTFGQGGQADIVDHGKTGYIAQHLDALDLARGIEWALGSNIERQSQRQVVENRFSADAIAQRYIDLIDSLQ